MKTSSAVGERTIQDFGEQWVHYGDNDGFYGSTELFADIIGPLLSHEDFAGRRVAGSYAEHGPVLLSGLFQLSQLG